MTTGIRGCENQSDTTVSVINVEHPGDSVVLSAKSYSDVYAWISQHRNTPLSVQTKKGTCSIWDENWEIRGQWVGDPNTVLLAAVHSSPKDFKMTVDETGDITIAPL